MQDKLNEIVNFINVQQQHLIAHEKRINKLTLQTQLIRNITNSKSQFLQDLFVQQECGNKRGGYFVEFGGTDGVEGSNSHLLEKDFGWQGIVAEPAKCWHEALKRNRKCHIDTRCVWSTSNESIDFCEANAATLSTATEFIDRDMHGKTRKENNTTYAVETVSLTDLLGTYDAPRQIDYLSIDTEGSEFSILSNFDFSKYKIKVITVEHNWTPDRERIYSLLTSHGYERKHTDLTDCDDWYVLAVES
jgi:FkbM family methyltransferase